MQADDARKQEMGNAIHEEGTAIHGEDQLLDGWVPNPSPRAQFIQELPEFVKLILATILVALVVHFFLAARRNNNDESPIVHGWVGAVGSSSEGPSECVDDDLDEIGDNVDDDSNKEDGQVLGESAVPEEEAATKKTKKVPRDAKKERNYDKLICKKEDEISTDDGAKNESANVKTTAKSNKKDDDAASQSNNAEDDAPAEPNDTAPEEPPPPPPPMELKSQAKHPGLQGYYNWHSTITSLYRIYAIPHQQVELSSGGAHTKFHQAVLPMHPSSERGQVSIYIEVVNRTSHKIDVYWIDYKGNEVHKGSIPTRGGVWSQTTYIGHPWTFRIGEGEENVLLKYAPFRIIPSVAGVETSRLDYSGNVEGIQKFVIKDVREGHVSRVGGLVPVCWVEDTALPEPPLMDTLNPWTANTSTSVEMQNAIKWSCQQMQREDAIYQGNGIASAKRLLQYLKNICLHPDDPKYRRLRLGNRIFQETIYNTGARGVLLALGFEELYGYLECGPGGGKMLSHERIQQVSDAMMVVNQTLKVMTEGSDGLAQAEGSDGFGRAGFGHAGGMNL